MCNTIALKELEDWKPGTSAESGWVQLQAALKETQLWQQSPVGRDRGLW